MRIKVDAGAAMKELGEFTRRMQHGRQLLDKQFDQQVGSGHHAASTSLSATIFALTASAQGLGAIGNPRRWRLSR